MKKLMMLVAFISPVFAQAFVVEKVECLSADKTLLVEAYYYFEGTYEEMINTNDMPAKAWVRVSSQRINQWLLKGVFEGIGNYSAKGPYFELSGGDKNISLFIAAPASHSWSEITLKGSAPIEIWCN